MKKNIVTLNRILIIFLILFASGCTKKKCFICSYQYEAGYYYNPTTHDTIILNLNSNNYGLDTIEKYYGYGG